jgi:C1A family cysteine protease
MASNGLHPDEIQAAIAREGARWTAGPTPFADLSEEERQLFLGYTPGPNEPSLLEREQVAHRNLVAPPTMAVAAAGVAPPAYDLRNVDGRNFITPIKSQGGCGSCVAFGTIAAIEGTLKVALNDPDLDVDLSEAHLFYCHARREGRRCGGSNRGWWVEPALRAVQNNGIVDEGCYPYVAGDQDCNNLCGTAASRLTFIDSWRRYVTAASMKIWISSIGPLIACFSVYDDFFSYTGGVYSHVSGDFAGGHCVCVVGYNDDEQCWICKNSWIDGGVPFGEGGFFRIAYGQCGIDAEMWTVEGVRPPAAVREAQFVSQSTPIAALEGQGYDVAVTMRNMGIQTWTPNRRFRLGSQSPQDNTSWGLGRVELPGRVAPWQDAVFRFRVTAPVLPAHFQWRMLQENVEWFGDYTPDTVVPRIQTPVRYGATLKLRHASTGCSLHSHPVNYGHPASSGQQQVTCFAGADDNDLWRIKGPDGQPPNYRSGEPIQHGDVVRLEHVVTRRNLHSHTGFPSPVTGQQEITGFGDSGIGDGNDDWRVEVDGGGRWDAGKTVRLIHVPTDVALHSHSGWSHPVWTMGQQEVTGYAGRDYNDLWFASDFRPRDAQFISQLVPATLLVGEDEDVSVTMRNVGTETWSPGSQFRLGSQRPPDNRTWGPTRVELAGPVAPGDDATFSFHITAPANSGTAYFQWQMLQEGVEWFGEPSRSVAIRIFRATGPTTVPDVEGMTRVAAANAIRAADLVAAFSGPPGNLTEVAEQSPAAGTEVDRGSTVTLRMVRLV